MKRRALIIGSPDEKIPGVNTDMINLQRYLKSYAGGGWRDDEIVILKSPNVAELSRQLDLLKSADYSFVSFAGHGAYSVTDRSTLLELNKLTKIDADGLKIGAPRRTVLIDACRVLTKSSLRERIVKSAINLESHQDLSLSRMKFEKALNQCPPGLATLYSCSIAETADETLEDGGFYTSALIQGGEDFARGKNSSSAVFSISDVHDVAKANVRKRSGFSQNPTAELPRSLPHFPFAVC